MDSMAKDGSLGKKRKRETAKSTEEDEEQTSQEDTTPMVDDNRWFVYNGQYKRQIPKTVGHISIDPSIRVIFKGAFANRNSLVSVKMHNTVHTIAQLAFSGCTRLSEIPLHEGLKYVGEQAFQMCNALEDVTIPETVTKIGMNVFYHCDSLKRVHLSTGLKYLPHATFMLCQALCTINLPNGLCSIGESAFNGCKSLRELLIPSTVVYIGERAFQDCESLTDVILPPGLKKINERAFVNCTSLSGVVMSLELENIEMDAFSGCTSLIGIEFQPGNGVRMDQRAFGGCSALMNVCISCLGNQRTNPWSFGQEDYPFYRNEQLRTSRNDEKLSNRFDHLPIHCLCYHSSETTVDDLKGALDSINDVESTELKDYLNMTPFHIVATSANPRLEILECLLNHYPIEMLEHQDVDGKTMLDYMLMHKSRKIIPLLQLALRKAVVEKTGGLGLGVRLGLELQQAIDGVTNSTFDTTTAENKREQLCNIFFKVAYSIREEMACQLELALWKRQMNNDKNTECDETTTTGNDRESCRYKSGAQVVIKNAIGYLWVNQESNHDMAHSIFPLCSMSPLPSRAGMRLHY
ncbi:unnamed protein product [Cylindrotheca closterium]|uniref:Uncharacterized protein n=1 Tax=Cylindrotheca closterium TaxID=2856 RepID=A0AAD2G2R3_9STRA|nr:unnamed protein product [Cylindrotheca closterium]